MEMPSVLIAMAIYKPNIKWLVEQLDSLNEQTYSSLKLIVWNDCPADDMDYQKILKEHITNFKWMYYKGKENLGSTGVFAELTKLADTKYIAYCDQDDIWLPQKITRLVENAEQTGVELICSDMFVIDKDSKVVASSITKVRRRHVFYFGKDVFNYLLARNFVTGCTTLVRSDFAKRALPFPKEFVHDWWLGLCAAAYGKISIIKEPLIKYRIHGGNQTGVLAGVNDKESYYRIRLVPWVKRIEIIKNRFIENNKNKYIKNLEQALDLRLSYFKKPSIKKMIQMFNTEEFKKEEIYFEIVMAGMPKCIFQMGLKLIQNENI